LAVVAGTAYATPLDGSAIGKVSSFSQGHFTIPDVPQEFCYFALVGVALA